MHPQAPRSCGDGSFSRALGEDSLWVLPAGLGVGKGVLFAFFPSKEQDPEMAGSGLPGD